MRKNPFLLDERISIALDAIFGEGGFDPRIPVDIVGHRCRRLIFPEDTDEPVAFECAESGGGIHVTVTPCCENSPHVFLILPGRGIQVRRPAAEDDIEPVVDDLLGQIVVV